MVKETKVKIYIKKLILALIVIGAIYQALSVISICTGDKKIHMIYEVKTGESLYTVARKFGTTTDKLKELNDIKVVDAVLPGMRLKIDR